MFSHFNLIQRMIALGIALSTLGAFQFAAAETALGKDRSSNSRLGWPTNPSSPIQRTTGIYSKHSPLGLTGKDIFKPRTKSLRRSLLDEGTYQCLAEIGEGIWNSTGGFVEVLGETISDPAAAWDKGAAVFDEMKELLANIENELIAAYGNITQLDPEIISTLICTSIGEIGTDVVLTALTGGAGSAKLSAKIALKLKKVSSITGILNTLNRIPLSAKERAKDLISRFIRSNSDLDGSTKSDISTFSEANSGELALDRLECALR